MLTRIAILILLSVATANAAASGSQIAWSPVTFVSDRGERTPAERGVLKVPARHAHAGGPKYALVMIRFKSTSEHPGPPIVYLAGGPGGSGIAAAKGPRFRLFQKLRADADVIALDQRGTGASSKPPVCAFERPLEGDTKWTEAAVQAFLKHEAAHCRRFWAQRHVDLGSFNTWESAADLDDLRRALGVDKIALWGISYGTHLALAALKSHPDSFSRAVLVSSEDLDQTLKLPARSERYFRRLAAFTGTPDLVPRLHRLLDRLDRRPRRVTVADPRTKHATRLWFTGYDLRLLLSFFYVADPARARTLPARIKAMEGGDFARVAGELLRLRGLYGGFRGMPEAMDLASWTSPERLALVKKQARSAIIGDALNFPLPLLDPGDLGLTPLPPSYRVAFASSTPVLLFSGTLDGRTFPEAHRETASQFEHATLVKVVNAGHNLMMPSPQVQTRIVQFLGGAAVAGTPIVVAASAGPH
ncbi:MAG: alpha/beta fold hydrolase [Rhodanobacteraceae bacterium]